MITSRGTRRLGLDFEDIQSAMERKPEAQPDQPVLTKAQLRELFSDEINFIISDELKVLKAKAEKDLRVEFDQKLADINKRTSDQLNAIEREMASLNNLAASLQLSYQQKVAEEISMLDEMVTEICMQSLYKIVGDPDCYSELIEKNIIEVIQKKSLDSKVILKVSENDMKFLKKNFSDASWIDCLRVDIHLGDGEMVLDDGVASLYEVGFINQLDVLRSAFIKLVRSNNAN